MDWCKLATTSGTDTGEIENLILFNVEQHPDAGDEDFNVRTAYITVQEVRAGNKTGDKIIIEVQQANKLGSLTMRTIFTAIFIMLVATSAFAGEVKYIEAPKFDGQIYLYDNPDKSDVDFEQWYEIEGRGQFVRNVKVPAMIPYLPKPENANGAAIIIAPGGAFLHHTFGSGGYEAAEFFRGQGFAVFIVLKLPLVMNLTINHM
ncbi:MAG: hypothetical protein IJT21_11470 [Synergistaceae bacterium]|nr:hypothetical protein [Synergistaceae bacterium]